jgi:hypothetical protein
MTKHLVLIGLTSPKFNIHGLAEGFRDRGYKVTTVSADQESPNNAGQFDYHLIDEWIRHYQFKPKEEWKSIPKLGYFLSKDQLELVPLIQYMALRFPVKPLIDKIEKDHGIVDRILFGQADILLDMTGLEYDYYFTEDWRPLLPYGGKLNHLFYGFVGGDECFKRSFGYEYQHCAKEPRLLYYGMDLKALPVVNIPWQDRKIDFGFKGLIHFNSKSRDLKIRHMYDERRKMIRWCEDQTIIPFVYDDHDSWDRYIAFMSQCKIALNIPGVDGWINQRQFEAIGFGCLLLQYAYPELSVMGFENRVNCLTFEDEEQLQAQLQWIKAHPDLAQEIAAKGRQLFIDGKYSWQDRAADIISTWETPPTKEWTAWLETLAKYEMDMLHFSKPKSDSNYDFPHPYGGMDFV